MVSCRLYLKPNHSIVEMLKHLVEQAQSERKKAETELQAKQEQLQREQEVSWQGLNQQNHGGLDQQNHVDFTMNYCKLQWELERDQ